MTDLQLKDAFIAAAVRCAPPDNKPTPEEIVACQTHLEAELAQLPNVQVVVALGKIAFDAWWRVMAGKGVVVRPRPEFGHGVVHTVKGSPVVIGSYHPSRQNTNTGKLTASMMASVFRKAASARTIGCLYSLFSFLVSPYCARYASACSCAWYELRTSGPDSTWANPMSRAMSFRRANSSGGSSESSEDVRPRAARY